MASTLCQGFRPSTEQIIEITDAAAVTSTITIAPGTEYFSPYHMLADFALQASADLGNLLLWQVDASDVDQQLIDYPINATIDLTDAPDVQTYLGWAGAAANIVGGVQLVVAAADCPIYPLANGALSWPGQEVGNRDFRGAPSVTGAGVGSTIYLPGPELRWIMDCEFRLALDEVSDFLTVCDVVFVGTPWTLFWNTLLPVLGTGSYCSGWLAGSQQDAEFEPYVDGLTTEWRSMLRMAVAEVDARLLVEALIVGGGGGGGGRIGGGGGAGGLVLTSLAMAPGEYEVVIGAGGAGGISLGTAPDPEDRRGDDGEDSTALGLTATGGGGGAEVLSLKSGRPGGSGGGAQATGTGGAGTTGQGFDGGTTTNANWAAGGGGASEVGHSPAGATAGAGGDGVESDISGTPTYYAGGGGGGVNESAGSPGAGGLGGGGAGGRHYTAATKDAVSGTANTGGGGGGAGYNDPVQPSENAEVGGAGGSGIVIIRYPGEQRATGGTITSVGGYTIHTFTADGTWRLE